MEIALYIRKEYFRGVTLTDKSAHILEFHYEGEHVDVFENGGLVFRFRYVLETKFKANIVEFYIPGYDDAWKRIWKRLYVRDSGSAPSEAGDCDPFAVWICSGTDRLYRSGSVPSAYERLLGSNRF